MDGLLGWLSHLVVLVLLLQSEMLQESNISKFKSQVQSSQVLFETKMLGRENYLSLDFHGA